MKLEASEHGPREGLDDASGGDVVLSSNLFEQPGVAQVVDNSKLAQERLVKTLRGVEKEVQLVRIRC